MTDLGSEDELSELTKTVESPLVTKNVKLQQLSNWHTFFSKSHAMASCLHLRSDAITVGKGDDSLTYTAMHQVLTCVLR